jgi:hypothetical protein
MNTMIAAQPIATPYIKSVARNDEFPYWKAGAFSRTKAVYPEFSNASTESSVLIYMIFKN